MTSAKRKRAAAAEELFNKAEKYEEMDDFKSAFKCLLAAAQLGDAGSQLNLGNLYASGTGIRKSLSRAAYWYKRAYKSGERAGALNLAIDRRSQGRVRSAISWFKKAIATKDGAAYIELAKIYKARKGGRKASVDLLKRALRLGRDDISEAAREEAESMLMGLSR